MGSGGSSCTSEFALSRARDGGTHGAALGFNAFSSGFLFSLGFQGNVLEAGDCVVDALARAIIIICSCFSTAFFRLHLFLQSLFLFSSVSSASPPADHLGASPLRKKRKKKRKTKRKTKRKKKRKKKKRKKKKRRRRRRRRGRRRAKGELVILK